MRVKRGVVRGRKAHGRVSETDQGKDLRQMPLLEDRFLVLGSGRDYGTGGWK